MLLGRARILGKGLCQREILFAGDYWSVLIVRLKIYHSARGNCTPLNFLWTGRWPIFDVANRLQLEAFVTRNSRIWHLGWEAISLEMSDICSADTVKCVIEELGYSRLLPRRKFAICPKNKPLSIVWYCERLDWRYENWLWAVWTDKSIFSMATFENRPWVTRKATEKYHVDCVDKMFELGRETKIVWGAFLLRCS